MYKAIIVTALLATAAPTVIPQTGAADAEFIRILTGLGAPGAAIAAVCYVVRLLRDFLNETRKAQAELVERTLANIAQTNESARHTAEALQTTADSLAHAIQAGAESNLKVLHQSREMLAQIERLHTMHKEPPQ